MIRNLKTFLGTVSLLLIAFASNAQAEFSHPINQDTLISNKSTEYKVALLLPFQANKIVTDSLGNPEGIPSVSRLAIEFYEGVRLALDSLQQDGISLKLFVFDTQADTNHLKVILTNPQMQSMDLIIGPVYNSELNLAQKFAAKYHVPLISPLSSNFVTADNPFFISANASLKSHCESIFNYITQHDKPSQIIFIYRNNDNEKNVMNYFNSFNQKSGNAIKFVSLTDSSSRTQSSLLSTLTDSGKNIIIIPSFSETFVYSVSKTLNAIAPQRNITVYGMPTWKDFESLQLSWMDTLHMHFTTNTWYQKSDSATTKLMNDYQSKFDIKPTDFSLQGYDIMQYTGELLMTYGKNITQNFTLPVHQTLMNRFMISPVINGDHTDQFENKFVFMLQFDNGTIQIVKQ